MAGVLDFLIGNWPLLVALFAGFFLAIDLGPRLSKLFGIGPVGIVEFSGTAVEVIVFGVTLLIAAFSLPNVLPPGTERADGVQTVVYAANNQRFNLRTLFRIDYEERVNLGSTLKITINITQEQRLVGSSGDWEQLRNLRWPVHIELESADFAWAAGKQERNFQSGAGLPLDQLFVPTALNEGQKIIALRLKNLADNRVPATEPPVVVRRNGKVETYGENDDVPLPVEIRPETGIPLWMSAWEDHVKWAIGIIGVGGFVAAGAWIYRKFRK